MTHARVSHRGVSSATPTASRQPARASALPAAARDLLGSHDGQQLDGNTRAFMESRFGRDFGSVRIHADAGAAASADALHARAYTVGQDVVFAAREFAPATDRGRELIAHELAHTVQQRGASHTRSGADRDATIEASAEAAGRAAANGVAVTQPLPMCGIGVSRAPATAVNFDDQELAERLLKVTERLKQATYPERDSDLGWLPMLQAEAERRAKAKQSALPVKPAEPRKPPPDPARERAEAVVEAKAQIARMEAAQKDDADDAAPAAKPARRKGGYDLPKKFTPGGFTDADVYRESKEANDRIDYETGPAKDPRPFKVRLAEARRKAPMTMLPSDFPASAYEYGHSAGLFSPREENLVKQELGAPLQERRAAQDKREKIQFDYQQQLKRDQFYNQLQLAPIQGALMGGVGVFGNAAKVAYTTYSFADTGVQLHRAVTSGSPSDVVGALLPLASGLIFNKMIGGGEPAPPTQAARGQLPAAAGIEEVSPAQVREAYAANPHSVQHSGSNEWHQQQWEANGGGTKGTPQKAPLAFRIGDVIRVNEQRWLAVGELSEINTPADLAPSKVVPTSAKVNSPDAFAKTGDAVDPVANTGAAPVQSPNQTKYTVPPVRPAAAPARLKAQPAVPAGPRGPTPVEPAVVVEAHGINPDSIVPSYSSEFHASVWRNNHGGKEVPVAYRIGDKIRVDVERLPHDVRAAIGYAMML